MTEPRSRVALESEATAKVVTRPEARIDVSAQLISMEPGLYAVSVVAPALARTEGGMVLPCIRMDPLPDQDRVRAFFASLADSSLLVPSATPAYLHIVGGRASILLTTYKASGPMPPPDIHIRMVEPVPVAALEHGPGGSEKVDGQSGDALASASLRLLVHLQNHGDVVFPGGVWAMAPDGDGSVEGFCISGSDELPPGSLEYQAVLGSDWVSPWMEQGEFCGSRQMALPLLGVRIRLREPASRMFQCRVWGRFSGVERGPFDDGAVCDCDGAVLTGLRVVVVPGRPAERISVDRAFVS